METETLRESVDPRIGREMIVSAAVRADGVSPVSSHPREGPGAGEVGVPEEVGRARVGGDDPPMLPHPGDGGI